ncbi:MAG: adenylate/guanylate cyclase domain-containing protein [Thermosynechococcaceae cyanobacterium]
MAEFVDILASYVPSLIVRHLQEVAPGQHQASSHSYSAAVLFADISGFTPLTEALAHSGPAGLEDLSQILNTYFGHITDLILAHGGDVLKFAGDSVLAVWIAPDHQLSLATHRAAACGLTIQTYAHTYCPPEGVDLTLKICLAVGEIAIAHVGGLLNRWEYTVTGEPLVHISRLFRHAPLSGVALSPEAWVLVQQVGEATPLNEGDIWLQAIAPAEPSAPPPQMPLSDALGERLRAYIPGAILARLSAGQRDWLAEYRRVTVLFVNLPTLNETASIERIQSVIVTLQNVLYRFEGSINKISVDDKGITLIAALGLSPFAHEDDPERAVRAALAMQDGILAQGEQSQIGISTGSVFCGTIGSIQRREYTVIGEVVNLAARLMQVDGEAILCDENTYLTTQSRVVYKILTHQRLKGFENPVPIFQPLQLAQPAQAHSTPLIGCQRERRHLVQMAQLLMAEHQVGIAILEGEAGIGKSQLLTHFLGWSQEHDLPCFLGTGDAIEALTPYYAWRPIMAQLLSLQTDASERHHQILALLGTRAILAPLLNGVLDVEFAETDLTEQMQGSVRAENIRVLLQHLLEQGISAQPTILAFEDAHWLDSASWALLLALSQKQWPILVVLATRPLAEPLPESYQLLLTADHTKFLRLPGLSRSETQQFVSQQLEIERLSDAVTTFIYEKAEGHPLLSEELAYALRDRGRLQITGGWGDWVESSDALQHLELPTTLQGLMTSRIDQLLPAQQLLLKSASVIGRSFLYPLLYDIYPLAADKADLPQNLQGLNQKNLVVMESPEPLSYTFRHILMQEVTYQLMLFSQRRELHRAIATWYEQSQRQDAYGLLAYHWSRAEDDLKALEYLDKAGEQALTSGAYQEAVAFFSQALARPQASHPSQIRWHRQLGEAYLGLGQLSNSESHLQAAVTLLGQPLPALGLPLWLSLLKQAGRQLWHRLRPRSVIDTPTAQQLRALELTRAYVNLGEVYYYTHRRTLATYASITGLNHAETVDPALELARTYANMCFAMGLNQRHSLARRYGILAETTVQTLDASLPCLGWVAMVVGAYHSGSGRWSMARERLQLAIDSYQTVSDRHHLAESLAALALVEHCQGNFSAALTLWQQIDQLGHQCGDIQAQAWGLLGQVEETLAMAADHATALSPGGLPVYTEVVITQTLSLIHAAQRLLKDRPALVSEQIRLAGLSAIVFYHQQEWSLSKQAVERGLKHIQQSPPIALYVLEGYASLLEVSCCLQEPALCSLACSALTKYAQAFPIGRPRLLYWQGHRAAEQGKIRKAKHFWNQGLSAAQRFKMPYEKAQIQSAWDHLAETAFATIHP